MRSTKKFDIDKLVIESVEDIEGAVKLIGEAQAEIDQIAGKAKVDMNKIKAGVETDLRVYNEFVKGATEKVEKYCNENRGIFGDKKSMKTVYGDFGFKASKVVETSEKTLAKIKKIGLDHLVSIKETIDKAAIKKLDAPTLKRIDARIVDNETFFIKPAKLVLPAAA